MYDLQVCSNQPTKDICFRPPYISLDDGPNNHQLMKCIEVDNKYLLLVDWNTLEDHTIGFRTSEAYLEWKKILHHYYEPFPIVEHFETVFENKK